jgi:thymidylate synthase
MTEADRIYVNLLQQILSEGEKVDTRNSITTSHFNLPNVTFTEFPLVTLKKTAVKKCIQEMEWFLSGDSKCPEELLDWWDGQLDSFGHLHSAYPEQLRAFTSTEHKNYEFDQLKFIIDGLRNSPNSRRLLMTVWNPGDMASITKTNNNPNTPTCCHSIIIQFFVRQNTLHMKSYARSQDMLLGTPHNWTQSWAFLLYLAHHTNLQVGSMTWMWGDAHIYEEKSHTEAVKAMVGIDTRFAHWMIFDTPISLVYQPEHIQFDSNNVPIFRAEDFKVIGEVPEPVVKHKIKLL